MKNRWRVRLTLINDGEVIRTTTNLLNLGFSLGAGEVDVRTILQSDAKVRVVHVGFEAVGTDKPPYQAVPVDGFSALEGKADDQADGTGLA